MLLGYYVGYKKTVHGDDKPYLFETVEFIKEQGHEHQLQISNLEVFTEYAVVVQAFNKIGQGKQNSARKSSVPQNSHNVSRIMVGILIRLSGFFLPNTLWSFRFSTRLGKVSRILFKKAADHKILTMLAELWSEF